MEDQNGALDHRELTCKKGVEDDAEGNDGHDKECPVPTVINVAAIVQNDQALDHGPYNKDEGGKADLPSNDSNPAC